MKKLTVIDLFSGAGGLSEGFLETGKFSFLAHVEWEAPMVNTLRNNLVKRWNYTQARALKTVIQFDIQKTNELIFGNWSDETIGKYGKQNSAFVAKNGLKGLVGDNTVDLIIGGPPCQAYSIAGRAQDPHSMRLDYRNYLFESFVKVVDSLKPKAFVFENVPGILSAKPGGKLVIERICDEFSKIGYEIRTPSLLKKSIYSASDFGVPQNRRRVIIFGVKKGLNFSVESLYTSLDNEKNLDKKTTVREAIGFLPKFEPLKKAVKVGSKNVSHVLLGEVKIPLHVARYNNLRDINVFRKWIHDDMNYISNDKKLEFYFKNTGKRTNHNKYRNLEWDKQSPTIVSHLSKDGLMFIHPDYNQARTITIREAALLQTFPIDYEFIGSDAYCFKMIGNAVPVLFSKHIGEAVYNIIEVNYGSL